MMKTYVLWKLEKEWTPYKYASVESLLTALKTSNNSSVRDMIISVELKLTISDGE